MSKRNDKKRRSDLLPQADEFYFDDDLDSVTRGLPTEEEYFQTEEPEEAEELPLTEGIGRAGVRMVGLPAQEEDFAQEDGYSGLFDDEEDEGTVVYSGSAQEEQEDVLEEEYLTPRQRARREAANAKAVPLPVTRKAKKQKRVAPVEEDTRSSHPRLRAFIMTAITVVLLLFIGMMLLSRTMMPDTSFLKLPENAVSSSVGPVQAFFSHLWEDVAGYFRNIKLRSNIEQEYNKVVAQNEEYAYLQAMAAEYEIRLRQYEAIDEEMQLYTAMTPIRCQVIGRENGQYFSTFTIDQGSRNGVEPYMAVIIDGALIGYTEQVYDTTATVRTIIDSNASIAALVQSSRDQGTVRGTLGTDGQPMCRMYYLPADHLPRPGDIVVTSGIGMSFPKGIPIGTVRESTRSMEQNKQYIVVEPLVDFEHIEYVIVLRYQPPALAVTSREATNSYSVFEPTESARPYPTLRIGTTQRFGETPAPSLTPSVTPTPTPTPSPTPVPTATPSPTPEVTVLEFNASQILGPTATPSPSPTPSPTPAITIDPSQMTWEN